MPKLYECNCTGYRKLTHYHVGPKPKYPNNPAEALALIQKQLIADGGIPDVQQDIDGSILITCEKFPTFRAKLKGAN